MSWLKMPLLTALQCLQTVVLIVMVCVFLVLFCSGLSSPRVIPLPVFVFFPALILCAHVCHLFIYPWVSKCFLFFSLCQFCSWCRCVGSSCFLPHVFCSPACGPKAPSCFVGYVIQFCIFPFTVFLQLCCLLLIYGGFSFLFIRLAFHHVFLPAFVSSVWVLFDIYHIASRSPGCANKTKSFLPDLRPSLCLR